MTVILYCTAAERRLRVKEVCDFTFNFLCSGLAKKHPIPSHLIITPASEANLNVFRDNWSGIGKKMVFADKAYQDTAMKARILTIRLEVLSPVKYPRGVPERIKQMSKATDYLFSKAIFSIRQPIESLFSCIIEKSDIQRASKVRSTNELFVYIFNKLAVVFLQKYFPTVNSHNLLIYSISIIG